MSTWTKKTKSAPGVDVGGKTPPIPVGGRDAPGHGFDPKKIVQEVIASKLSKDATVQGDDDSPGLSPGLVGAGFAWHKLPKQAPITEKRQPPRLVVGPTAIGATYTRAPTQTVGKDDAATGDEATDAPDNNGRPQWMASPGQGGKDPVYRSQKPGANGNNDELFSDNVNDKPPKVTPVDADAYYIW